MEKTTWETIIAVVIGILIGIFAASAFWLVKTNKISFSNSSSINNQQVMKKNPTPTKSDLPFSMSISEPTDQSIVSTENISVKVKTLAFANVVISTNGDTVIIKADDKGNVSEEINLNEGLNQIIITAIKDSSQEITKNLLIVYEKK